MHEILNELLGPAAGAGGGAFILWMLLRTRVDALAARMEELIEGVTSLVNNYHKHREEMVQQLTEHQVRIVYLERARDENKIRGVGRDKMDRCDRGSGLADSRKPAERA